MKIYVVDTSGHRIYLILPSQIERRSQLPTNFTAYCKYCRRIYTFTRNDVMVESDLENATVGGATLGGLIGILGGPYGILFGAAIGTAIGRYLHENDLERIRNF
jgi:hypothetical protein